MRTFICFVIVLYYLVSINAQIACPTSCTGIPSSCYCDSSTFTPSSCCGNNNTFWSTAAASNPLLNFTLVIMPTANPGEPTCADIGNAIIRDVAFATLVIGYPIVAVSDLNGSFRYNVNPSGSTGTANTNQVDGNTGTNSGTNGNNDGNDESPAIEILDFFAPMAVFSYASAPERRQGLPPVVVDANGNVVIQFQIQAYFEGFVVAFVNHILANFLSVGNFSFSRLNITNILQLSGKSGVTGMAGIVFDGTTNNVAGLANANVFVTFNATSITGESNQAYSGTAPFWITTKTDANGVFVLYAIITGLVNNFNCLVRGQNFAGDIAVDQLGILSVSGGVDFSYMTAFPAGSGKR